MSSTAAANEVADLHYHVDALAVDLGAVLAALLATDAVTGDIRSARRRMAEAVTAATRAEAALAAAVAELTTQPGPEDTGR